MTAKVAALRTVCAICVLFTFFGTAHAQINWTSPPLAAPTEDPTCAKLAVWEGVGWSACGLAQGLFVYSHTDLTVPGPMPIVLRRTYRQNDSTSRMFGPGWNFDYGMYLYSPSQAAGQGFQNVEVVMPDGANLFCNRTSSCTQNGCTDYTDATFSCTSNDDPVWYASNIWYDTGSLAWWLERKDGTEYEFGTAAPLQKIHDPHGNSITISRTNGQTGNITSITSSNNRYLTVSYTNNLPTSIQDQAGRTVQYGYDSSGRLSTVKDPNSNVTTYTYSTTSGQTDNLASIKDANLNTLKLAYVTSGTPLGALKTMTMPDTAASTWKFAYTLSSGLITAVTITDGNSTQRAVIFNSAGYETSDTLGSNTTGTTKQLTSYTRDANTNFILDAVDALNRDTHTTYDFTIGQPLTNTKLYGTSNAAPTSFTYGGSSNCYQVTQITDPMGFSLSYQYAILGGGPCDMGETYDRDNNPTILGYNTDGTLSVRIDAESNFTYYTEDTFGDLAKVQDPLGNLTTNSYDNAGRLTQSTDPLRNTTTNQYDNLNHVTQRSVPGAAASPSITTYGYDNVYNMTSMIDPNNHTWTWKYGDRNRLWKVCDPNSNCTQFTYDNNSNATQFSNASGTTDVFVYDKINRKITEKWGVVSGTPKIKDDYIFDLGNRMTQVVDQIAGTTTRTYDGQDQILTDQQASNGTITYQYDLDERRTTMSGAGPTVSYGYDNNGDLTSEYNSYFGTVHIGIDVDNRRSSVQLPNSVTEAYSYDPDSRLTSITYTNGSQTQIGNLGYTYDADGRRTETTGSLASLLPLNFYGNNNSQTFAYNKDGSSTFTTNDNDGNATIVLGVQYQYNERSQVKQIANLTSPVFKENFTYDPFGRRMTYSLSLNGGSPLVTNYLYDGVNIAKETTVLSAYVMNGLAPDDRFARYSAGVYQYYLTDAIGSVVALTDQNGVVQTQYSYGPFGATASTGAASDNPYQFAGRELDPNGGFGIYYFRARYYDSLELNRFLERDPNGLSGGNYATLYSYVGNSPLNGSDPTGQFFAPAGLNLPGDGTWDGLDIAFEDSISAAADAQAISAANAANNSSDNGGGTISSAGQGFWASLGEELGGTFVGTSSSQAGMADQDGNYMFPPGIGIGGTGSFWLDSNGIDQPIATFDQSILDLGKFGGLSAGMTLGRNPFTGAVGIMELHGTLGFGSSVMPGIPSITLPTVHLSSP